MHTVGLTGWSSWQGKNSDLIRRATFAMAGTQLAPTSAPAGQEIATFAGAAATSTPASLPRITSFANHSVRLLRPARLPACGAHRAAPARP